MTEVHLDPVKAHFNLIAKDYDHWKQKNAYYYTSIKSFVRKNIRPGSRILELGCATGEILASSRPEVGVGVDVSPEMIRIARDKFPQYTFVCSAIEDFHDDRPFDYIIMADLVDHVYDLIDIFERVHEFCHPETKIILTTINPWWEPIFSMAEKIGAKMPEGPHNFIEKRNLAKFVEFLDFSISYSGYLLLFPKRIPLLSFLANTIGVKIWGLNKLSSVQYMILRSMPRNETDLGYGCSIVIPCYNEAENIREAIQRIPDMGKKTEIIVVNDGSKDDTARIVQEMQKDSPNLKLIDYQPNKGKGYAVKQGFEAATQEILMILDADMTVPPEELERFFLLLNKGLCDFVNGTRMMYPMQEQAMRFLNLLGNKVFSLILSFITGQTLTDTLCGTKAFYKKDLGQMQLGLDKWGDYDLLFGAAKMGHRIMEIPVHYKARTAGESKMKTFRHGLHLLHACWRGFLELILDREPPSG